MHCVGRRDVSTLEGEAGKKEESPFLHSLGGGSPGPDSARPGPPASPVWFSSRHVDGSDPRPFSSPPVSISPGGHKTNLSQINGLINSPTVDSVQRWEKQSPWLKGVFAGGLPFTEQAAASAHKHQATRTPRGGFRSKTGRKQTSRRWDPGLPACPLTAQTQACGNHLQAQKHQPVFPIRGLKPHLAGPLHAHAHRSRWTTAQRWREPTSPRRVNG